MGRSVETLLRICSHVRPDAQHEKGCRVKRPSACLDATVNGKAEVNERGGLADSCCFRGPTTGEGNLSVISLPPATHSWQGKSGAWYTYFVYSWPALFAPNQSANYIFAGQNPDNGLWLAFFAGEEDDIGAGFEGRRRLYDSLRYGLTHIHVHASLDDALLRKREVSDLVRALKPSAQEPLRRS
jgi:hypothetical protein